MAKGQSLKKQLYINKHIFITKKILLKQIQTLNVNCFLGSGIIKKKKSFLVSPRFTFEDFFFLI